MREINKIIVHCSATPQGRDVSVQTIREWHLARGWSDIGYHYIISLEGKIETGRPVERQGAHVRHHNQGSIGVCYIGGMDLEMKNPKDTRTNEQHCSLEDLLLELKGLHPNAVISGHRDYSAKACPSFDATNEYKWISQL